MKTITVVRKRFNVKPQNINAAPLDMQLQDFLQSLEDNGYSLISVQQTHAEYASKNQPETFVVWNEYLIVSRKNPVGVGHG